MKEYIDMDIYLFVVTQLDTSFEWIQEAVRVDDVGGGCCNDVLTHAWLKQKEQQNKGISAKTTGIKQEEINSIRDADSAISALAELKMDVFDHLNRYDKVVQDSQSYMETWRILASMSSRTPQQEAELQAAQFWGPSLERDINPAWNILIKAWLPWRDYMTVFLQVTQKFLKDIPVKSVDSYKFVCLCSMFLCYKIILKAGFDDVSVTWHWGWIDAFFGIDQET
jgi:hypothetical protein